jgi:hypothetical protein
VLDHRLHTRLHPEEVVIMIEIKNRWTNEVIYRSETAQSVKEALKEAVRSGASLVGASLVGASLDGASLVGARLDGASLVGARLVRARLDGARLVRASLDGARLDGADLDPIRDDIYEVLSHARNEVPGLLAALREGRVNGSLYEGPCACLLGTIANVRGCDYSSLPDLIPDASRPAECWFMGVGEGDTPENSQVSRITVGWIEEWLAKHSQSVVAPGATP